MKHPKIHATPPASHRRRRNKIRRQRMRRLSCIVLLAINSLLNNSVFPAFRSEVLSYRWFVEECSWFFDLLSRSESRLPSYSGHQVSQSAQVVGGSGESKQPPYLLDSSQLHFS